MDLKNNVEGQKASHGIVKVKAKPNNILFRKILKRGINEVEE